MCRLAYFRAWRDCYRYTVGHGCPAVNLWFCWVHSGSDDARLTESGRLFQVFNEFSKSLLLARHCGPAIMYRLSVLLARSIFGCEGPTGRRRSLPPLRFMVVDQLASTTENHGVNLRV